MGSRSTAMGSVQQHWLHKQALNQKGLLADQAACLTVTVACSLRFQPRSKSQVSPASRPTRPASACSCCTPARQPSLRPRAPFRFSSVEYVERVAKKDTGWLRHRSRDIAAAPSRTIPSSIACGGREGDSAGLKACRAKHASNRFSLEGNKQITHNTHNQDGTRRCIYVYLAAKTQAPTRGVCVALTDSETKGEKNVLRIEQIAKQEAQNRTQDLRAYVLQCVIVISPVHAV